ncbi:MAG: hypothetical protein ACFBWO_06840 [Paracoccaceae bacterium]
MTLRTAAILLAGTALATTALAQSTGGGQSSGQSGQSAASSGQGSARGCAARREQAGIAFEEGSVESREEVVSNLEDAGMQDVRVEETSYLVEATTPKGNCVRLVIGSGGSSGGGTPMMGGTGSGTPAAAAGADQSGADASSDRQSASGGSSSDSMSSSGQSATGGSSSGGAMSSEQAQASMESLERSLSEAGYSDIRFLEAAYVVRGTSENGENVLMVVNAEIGTATGGDDR